MKTTKTLQTPRLFLIWFALLLSIGGGLSGCGGSAVSKSPLAIASSAPATGAGRARLTIQWPERSAAKGRLIPVAANSIVVTLKQNGAVVAQQTLARPASGNTTVADLTNLPLGAAQVSATAFPNSDGTGIAQASGNGSVAIVADTLTPITVVMQSTVDRINVSPSGPLNLHPGDTTVVTAEARDTNGALVLLSPSTASWWSNDDRVASISATGAVTAVGRGSTELVFYDAESNKSVSLSVNVAPPLPTPGVSGFYATQNGSRDIVQYDLSGKPIGTLTVPSTITTDLRGVAVGPDGLLYVVGATDPFTDGGFVVMTVDASNTIRVKYAYSNAYIGGNISHGKIAFDKNNRVLVGTLKGMVAFPLNGSKNSGTLLYQGEVYDIAVLPSGELLVMTNYDLLRMNPDGSNVQTVSGSNMGRIVEGRGVAYDALTNTIYYTMLGYSGDSFSIKSLDGTTYALKNTTSYVYADDLFITGDGRVLVGSRTKVPAFYDKALNKTGEFGGTDRIFVTEGTISGTTP